MRPAEDKDRAHWQMVAGPPGKAYMHPQTQKAAACACEGFLLCCSPQYGHQNPSEGSCPGLAPAALSAGPSNSKCTAPKHTPRWTAARGCQGIGPRADMKDAKKQMPSLSEGKHVTELRPGHTRDSVPPVNVERPPPPWFGNSRLFLSWECRGTACVLGKIHQMCIRNNRMQFHPISILWTGPSS